MRLRQFESVYKKESCATAGMIRERRWQGEGFNYVKAPFPFKELHYIILPGRLFDLTVINHIYFIVRTLHYRHIP